MKRAIIVHCGEGVPEYCWYPATKKELEALGFEVEVPAMPETELPKQEKWVAKHLGALNIKVAVCVGAGLDFIAGTVKRAPAWVQKIGLEWAWRLTRDPKRLWGRYLIEDAAFLGIFFREWVGLRASKRVKVDQEVRTR